MVRQQHEHHQAAVPSDQCSVRSYPASERLDERCGRGARPLALGGRNIKAHIIGVVVSEIDQRDQDRQR